MIGHIGRTQVLVVLCGTFALAGACATAPGQVSGPEPAFAQSTHSGCYVCHRSTRPDEAGASGFSPGVDPSLVCQDCHHYERNHHPVNVLPEATDFVNAVRSGLPLFDGRIRCLTCHEGHSGPASDGSVSPRLLRGGPYNDRRALCFRCHYQERYAEINPHRMIDETGAIRMVNGAPVCTLCHDQVPDVLDHRGDMSFRADVAFLCWRCHTPMAGEFLDKHFHVSPSEETRIQMDGVLEQHNIRLPLAVDGMLTCSTCHNPHQKGVLLEGPVSTGADEPTKLRIAQAEFCTACHRK